jgi:two-component system response regulator
MVPEAILAKPLLILLVEDDPDHTELIRRGLENYPKAIQLLHISDGEEALDYLFRRQNYTDAAQSPRPHFILLDLRLPKVDGLEVLRRIKASEELLRIPVVVLTSSNAEPDVTRAYRHRANRYLVKPVNPGQIRDLISAVRSYWLRWSRGPWCRHPQESENLLPV